MQRLYRRRRTDGSIRALARRVIHIRAHSSSGNTFLCSYWDYVGKGDVTNEMISFAVKYAAEALDYPGRGMPLDRIDTHSLRSGGACALSLAGYRDHEIMKMGRWAPKSTAFLVYIQAQLSSFSAGMSKRMRAVAPFTNMEGDVVAEDLRAATLF